MEPDAAAVDGESRPAPSLSPLPSQLVANAHRQTSQDMSVLHKKLATLYSPEQFEPTPIDPNHQLSMQENSRLSSEAKSPQQPRHERSDSLEFDKIFVAPKPPKSSSSNMDDLSNQLSNMSFSMGEIAAIQDECNLSSLFDDSIKLKDRSSSSGETGNIKTTRSGNNKSTPFNMSSVAPTDMSMSTFGGESLGNLPSMNMSTTSFTHVFDESTDKM